METIAQEALRLLEPIPDEEWMIGDVSNGKDKCCGWGHISRLTSQMQDNYSRYSILGRKNSRILPGKIIDSFEDFLKIKGEMHHYWMGDVNDGICSLYQQETPKKRIIEALKDMIEAGY